MRIPLLLGLAAAAALPSASRAADYQIAVIPKGTTHEYWKSINAGAVKAQRELHAAGTEVTILWKGPLLEDDREQQIQVVENFVGRNVSAIVLAPLDSRALAAPVEDAVRAGIPVVVIDSGLNSRAPSSVVATDNRKGGQIGARRLGSLLGGKGRVVLLRYEVGSVGDVADLPGQIGRHRIDVIRQVFPGSGHAGHGGLAAEFAFGADFARHARHFRGKTVQLVHHDVDGVLEFENFAFHVHGDFARQVAARHGGGHLRDVADLRRQVGRHGIDVVGQIFPGAGDAGHGGLAAQFAFGADFARHARHFGGKGAELIHHRR